ncbi:acyltransferase family protein [Alteromonas sp. RKMC-009]|uniref:acyltransferase family protein n=1 Tax=Alteromonas sp. RKMC-009 TaxID=2267264 RepID=UPI000E68EBA8|nr:DUF5009 domain-containing protein [Alteromonas sp. RKMC-009]AYA65829.1 DUF5009 domain-containing protein [Alteromonas sp. RKMC-009]
MKRLISLDVLRGLTIVLMVLVNNPGSWQTVYWPLLHAKWHGLTPTDLVFPFFIFVMGVAIPFSSTHQQSRSAVFMLARILKRSALLFLCGVFLALFYYNPYNADFDWMRDRLESIRVMGVLQRLALVYFFTAILAIFLRIRGLGLAAILLVAAYWAAMTFIPYADASGTVYQGQWAFGNSLSAWVDANVLGEQHVYYPDAKPFPFDPEGVFSTIPAISTCLIGVVCGLWLQRQPQVPAPKMMCSGFLLALFGGVLALWVPVNKALWSPSYTMLSAGCAMACLAFLHWIVDLRGYQRWAHPFVVAGANSIVFFMLSGIAARLLFMIPAGSGSLKGTLYQSVFLDYFSPFNASFLFAVSFLCVMYLPVWWMYRNKWFVRL